MKNKDKIAMASVSSFVAEGWAKAEAAITKGLELDPSQPELQLSLAALKLVNYRDELPANPAERSK